MTEFTVVATRINPHVIELCGVRYNEEDGTQPWDVTHDDAVRKIEEMFPEIDVYELNFNGYEDPAWDVASWTVESDGDALKEENMAVDLVPFLNF